MCNRGVKNYAHSLKFIPNQYKIQEMCVKAVNNYPSRLLFVPECYKPQAVW